MSAMDHKDFHAKFKASFDKHYDRLNAKNHFGEKEDRARAKARWHTLPLDHPAKKEVPTEAAFDAAADKHFAGRRADFHARMAHGTIDPETHEKKGGWGDSLFNMMHGHHSEEDVKTVERSLLSNDNKLSRSIFEDMTGKKIGSQKQLKEHMAHFRSQVKSPMTKSIKPRSLNDLKKAEELEKAAPKKGQIEVTPYWNHDDGDYDNIQSIKGTPKQVAAHIHKKYGPTRHSQDKEWHYAREKSDSPKGKPATWGFVIEDGANPDDMAEYHAHMNGKMKKSEQFITVGELADRIVDKLVKKEDHPDKYNYYLVHRDTGEIHGGNESRADAQEAAKDHPIPHAQLRVMHRSRVAPEKKEKFHRDNKIMPKLAKAETTCEDCEGTGKIYNNADKKSNQYVPCPTCKPVKKSEEEYVNCPYCSGTKKLHHDDRTEHCSECNEDGQMPESEANKIKAKF
jgi:hypothetical protein